MAASSAAATASRGWSSIGTRTSATRGKAVATRDCWRRARRHCSRC
jgi:hypothetical protein